MLHIKILAVGNIKEKFFREAISEYLKRLKPYCKIDIVEVNEEKIGDKCSLKDKERIIVKEGEVLLSRITGKEVVIALDIAGNNFSSETLASKLSDYAVLGRSCITFVIGGAFGISNEIIKRAELSMSLSKMTFTHQMARVILLEQIYRSIKINSGEPYHN